MHKFLSITTALALGACTVGPDYKMPDLHLPSGWFESVEKMPETDGQAVVEHQWWQHFGDPVLDQLIGKAIAGNYDIKIAEARIAEARASRSFATADLLPTINGTASGARQANRIAFPGPIAGLDKPFNTFEAGFDASWELDLFGGKRRALEADTALLAATEASRDDARVTLLAEVARIYMDIRQHQKQLDITHETMTAEEGTVSIAKERYKAGSTSQFDLKQAQAQLDQVKTQIPFYENLLAQAELSMDVLLGEQPGATHPLVETAKPIPVADKNIILAAPAQVIANRPDLRAAEQQLIAATAQQGIAVAQLFPDVSLSGFFGLLNADSGNLLRAGSKSWSAGGTVLFPILNYGRLSANIDSADARQQQALATYQKSVITALSDVDKAVTAYTKQEEFRLATARNVADNREITSIARMRYQEGLSSFVDVLEAQRTQYNSESQLAQAETLAAQNLVALYKSVGGGWKNVPKDMVPAQP